MHRLLGCAAMVMLTACGGAAESHKAIPTQATGTTRATVSTPATATTPATGTTASTGTTTPGTRAGCGGEGARTLVSTRSASVYAIGQRVYGCSRRTGHRTRLGSSGVCLGGATHVGPFALAGQVVAYASEFCGVDFGRTTIIVRRLSDGRVVRRHPATTTNGVESHQTVGSIVVRAGGAVAWIGTAQSIGPPHFLRQVQRIDARGFALLDSGRAVKPASLRLRGSTLRWRHGEVTRHASLG